MEFIHANLNVRDVEASVEYYTEQFGFEETWGFEADGTVHRYVADENGIEVQLSETEGVSEYDHGDAFGHLAFKVEDVDEAFDRIENHGVEKEPGDQPEAGARTAFILDPDGHTLELVGPLE
ncbi:VOC family protein [Natronorarus salvus]|uniref:VOC family protein n=1 Tax=Natronorarus salvus TaxID=3117733 RepID=UPI002F267D90